MISIIGGMNVSSLSFVNELDLYPQLAAPFEKSISPVVGVSFDLLSPRIHERISLHCDVVYFSDKDETIHKADMRTRIGVKETDEDSLICFCFGVSRAVAASNKKARDFVVELTKASSCSCELTNPSGQCCLKDFPKFKQ